MELSDLINNLNEFYDAGVSPHAQREAVARLTQTITDADLPRLIQPLGKGHWENAAMVLQAIGFPRIGTVADGLVRWLQDMNWPGARRIADTLKSLPDPEFISLLGRALVTANAEDDSCWLFWLRALVDEKGIAYQFDAECRAIMQKTEANF